LKKWLVVLSLTALAAVPEVATAATRPAEVPLWKRLLHAILPGAVPVTEHSVRPTHHRRGGPEPASLEASLPLPTASPRPSFKELRRPSASVQETRLPAAALPPLPPSRPDNTVIPPTATMEFVRPQSRDLPSSVTNQIGSADDAEVVRPPADRAPASTPAKSIRSVSAIAVPAATVAKSRQIAQLQSNTDEVGSLPTPELFPTPTPLPHPRPLRNTAPGVTSTGDGALALISPGALAPLVAPDQIPSVPSKAGCDGGQRILSAYYWVGRRTASGQPFNPHGMTAAHRTLPFGTHLTVTNPRTGQSVNVVVNDRGPFVRGVSLDLSLAAAKAIGMHGTGSVCIL